MADEADATFSAGTCTAPWPPKTYRCVCASTDSPS